MKILKKLTCVAVVGAALGMLPTAQANQDWAWTYTGTDVSASGLLTTAGSATSFELVLGISGTRNGSSITGLVPLGNPEWTYDQLFQASPPQFGNGGLLFSTADGHTVNLYSTSPTVMWDSAKPEGIGNIYNPGTQITFSVVAVPEMEIYAMMLAGLGLMGWMARRRNQSLEPMPA